MSHTLRNFVKMWILYVGKNHCCERLILLLSLSLSFPASHIDLAHLHFLLLTTIHFLNRTDTRLKLHDMLFSDSKFVKLVHSRAFKGDIKLSMNFFDMLLSLSRVSMLSPQNDRREATTRCMNNASSFTIMMETSWLSRFSVSACSASIRPKHLYPNGVACGRSFTTVVNVISDESVSPSDSPLWTSLPRQTNYKRTATEPMTTSSESTSRSDILDRFDVVDTNMQHHDSNSNIKRVQSLPSLTDTKALDAPTLHRRMRSDRLKSQSRRIKKTSFAEEISIDDVNISNALLVLGVPLITFFALLPLVPNSARSVLHRLDRLLEVEPKNCRLLCDANIASNFLHMLPFVSDSLQSVMLTMITRLLMYDITSSQAELIFRLAQVNRFGGNDGESEDGRRSRRQNHPSFASETSMFSTSSTSNTVNELQMLLLFLVGQLVERDAPTRYFHLRSQDSCMRVPISKFPSSKVGYTISFRLCISKETKSISSKKIPINLFALERRDGSSSLKLCFLSFEDEEEEEEVKNQDEITKKRWTLCVQRISRPGGRGVWYVFPPIFSH